MIAFSPPRDEPPAPKPIPPFRDGQWLSGTPADIRAETDLWRREAIRKLREEQNAFPCTPLIHVSAPGFRDVDFVFKNETVGPGQSGAWRSAWRLITWAVLEGVITRQSEVVDGAFGNTAIAQAHFLRLLGLKYTAVVPSDLDQIRLLLLQSMGVEVVQAEANELRSKAMELAASKEDAVFLDHRANGRKGFDLEEANCWQRSNNVLAEIMTQLGRSGRQRRATLSAAGHFVQKHALPTRIVLADSEFSAYFDFTLYNRFTNDSAESLWIPPGFPAVGYGGTDPLSSGRDDEPPVCPTAVSNRFVDRRGDVFPPSPRTSTRVGIDEKMAEHGGMRAMNCWLNVIQTAFQRGGDPLAIGFDSCPSFQQNQLEALLAA
ncbi:hypothetical protein M3Y99_00353800 [Aphelenchoides fujianensis]|nr:hypothetical protein M3Y99_00353800 [Aphelenchoides fujianensis]